MIQQEKWLGRGDGQGDTDDLEDTITNRHPSQLSGNQRRPVRAARAPGLFDECAEERDDVPVAQSRGAQLAAPAGDRLVERQL